MNVYLTSLQKSFIYIVYTEHCCEMSKKKQSKAVLPGRTSKLGMMVNGEYWEEEEANLFVRRRKVRQQRRMKKKKNGRFVAKKKKD
ncbi:hypothetical protein VNO78_10121 [Psophocarpus tetragonolobus]|uniref:Uncharacterized protein n=1 Tax=Psophocarpus tetragonolobus TaxID=3891 RepID=A0AAN9XMN6_PSOTE